MESRSSDAVVFGNKNWNNGATNGFVLFMNDNTTLRLNYKGVSASARGDTNMFTNVNNWTHVAMVFEKDVGTSNQGQIRYYQNGTLAGTINHNLTGGIGSLPLMLGQGYGANDGSSLYNTGSTNVTFQVQDFLLNGGAMTATEIAALAQ